MKKTMRALGALLCLALLISLCACGGSGSGYRIIDTYSAEGSYVIAFRQGDRLCEFATAALKEIAANGTLKSTSMRWFGENLISIKGEAGAMDSLWSSVPQRTITVGMDMTNMPMSYESVEGYMGFDVDVANYICGFLGWQMQIYPIDPADVDVELQSGNIDMAMGVPASEMSGSFSYTPVYLNSRYVLVARVTGRVKDRSAMKGKRLGVVITDLDILQQDEKFVESLGSVTYQTNTDGLFTALMNGEVDGILVSSVVAAYYMK